MNDWNKVEKTKRRANEYDIFFENVKIFLYVVAGLLYLYFLFIHKGQL